MKYILFFVNVILFFLLISCSNNSPKWTEETLSLTQENLEEGDGEYFKYFNEDHYVCLAFKNSEMKVFLVNVFRHEKESYQYQIKKDTIVLTDTKTGKIYQIKATLKKQGETAMQTYLILDGENLPEYIQSASYTKQ